jgi:hypothetical protein
MHGQPSRQGFFAILIGTDDSDAFFDNEARCMAPAQEHPDKITTDLALLLKHGNYFGTENLCQKRQLTPSALRRTCHFWCTGHPRQSDQYGDAG